jgi:hypothetical protein
MSDSTERNTGKLLNEKWQINARHALYREDGKWYHQLNEFPGALCDKNGYILFETKDDYLSCKYLNISKDVHINEGISSIPGYILVEDDIVDTDSLLDNVTYEGGSIYPYDMPEEVDVREEPQTVFEWMRKLKSGRLIIDPEFQRNLVWSQDQKSQFIESVLLNIPLPPLYVNQNRDGKYIIVDGLQRTTTLYEYIHEDSFKLANLKVLRDINNLRFSQLESRLQTKIEDKKFFVYVIKPSVPLQMVYDIFHRINTGGTQLTQQEIRNSFYIGPATRLLKDLSSQDYFKRAISHGISSKRMKDQEAILRYLSFRISDYKNQYKNNMDMFLGDALTRINLMTSNERDELKVDFKRVMVATHNFFGDNNFRLPTITTKGRINIAIMESVCYFFSKTSDQQLNKNKNKIILNYDLLLNNSEYKDSVQFATGDTRRVIRRFDLAQQILGRF